MATGKRYTREQKAAVVRAVQSGGDPKVVAKDNKISQETVRRWCVQFKGPGGARDANHAAIGYLKHARDAGRAGKLEKAFHLAMLAYDALGGL